MADVISESNYIDSTISEGSNCNDGLSGLNQFDIKTDICTTALSMHNLSVGYNGRAVVRDISADVRKGEILTLIGPNGAGKSTVLKTLTRQLHPVSGYVTVNMDESNSFNVRRHKISSKKLAQKMAVVLTERVVPELMTCREVVAMGRYPYTDSFGRLTEEDRQIVHDSLVKVNGLELADRKMESLSDGQRQRIMLARAICQQPEILILDEPTSYLDIRYKIDFMNILRAMANDGVTVIMSLHEISLARRISDRILCINGLSPVTLGTPDEIFSGDIIQKLFSISQAEYDDYFGE